MILILGKSGQVARRLQEAFGDQAVAWGRAELDLATCARAELRARVDELRPSLIVNAAAYTAVDRAESEIDACTRLNSVIPGWIGEAAQALGVPVIHYSTDYVYAGEGVEPQSEASPLRPAGVYARTKLEGERALLASGARALILRVAWVYDAEGANFLRTMLRLGRERAELRVVSDQVGSPTAARRIAEWTLRLATWWRSEKTQSLILNLAPQGFTSWHGFAEHIFKLAKDQNRSLKVERVEAIATSEYPTPARRPLNSRMDCRQADQLVGAYVGERPHWSADLKREMEVLRWETLG